MRLIFAAAALLALATPARASDVWGDGVEVIPDEELNALRGGLAITPQLEINFGALITTYVNGAPALTTNLTWTDMGQFVDHTVGQIGQRLSDLSPEARAALGLSELDGADGIVIADQDGVTALVHNITDSALQNIIVNTASGRDIRQEIDLTLELPGFEAIQASILMERIGMRLDADMRGVNFD